MFQRVKLFFDRLKSDRRLFLFFLLYVAICLTVTLLFTIWPEIVNKTILVLFFVALMLVTSFTWSLAALAIFRSLLVVGTGLSLLLFIAQSYCSLPSDKQNSNDALESLIALSVLFIMLMFGICLYRELFGNPEAKREFDKIGVFKFFRAMNEGKDPILLLVLYAAFMGLILGRMFQVLYPIFSNLCIYQ